MDQEPKYMFRPIAEDSPLANEASASEHHVIDHVTSGIRPQMTMTPTRPKLYSCWRRSEEAWSSTGSRHSSRPGSSTASSSRPPSQPNVPGATASMAQAAPAVSNVQSLYCKSDNSSLSDVSVARNFQQLSVSSRRALFKTQKWSHSFDQVAAQQAQMSPGRRRHVQNQQNKSLDLDSGYSGSWSMTSSALTELPTPTSDSFAPPVQARVSVCSPLESIKSEAEDPILHQAGWLSHPSQETISLITPTADGSNLLPSFPESFKPEVNLIPAANEESLDDLDEEIKMIVARAEHREGLLNFLEEQASSAECDMPIDGTLGVDEDLLYVRPEPVRTRNPLLCQKSSSSSGYETCISSVSDTVSADSNQQSHPHLLQPPSTQQPLAPPRTKRGQTKMALANKQQRATEMAANNVTPAVSAGKLF